MKRKLLLCAFTGLVFVVMGCGGVSPSADYPINMPFTEYSLTDVSCQWTSFKSGTVIVINSNQELEDYIFCEDRNYSEIDFSEHSLLLVRSGTTSGSILYIDVTFVNEAANLYNLNVIISTGMTAEAKSWQISVVTTKINNDANIALNVQEIKG